jgi:hypothetical protein
MSAIIEIKCILTVLHGDQMKLAGYGMIVIIDQKKYISKNSP